MTWTVGIEGLNATFIDSDAPNVTITKPAAHCAASRDGDTVIVTNQHLGGNEVVRSAYTNFTSPAAGSASTLVLRLNQLFAAAASGADTITQAAKNSTAFLNNITASADNNPSGAAFLLRLSAAGLTAAAAATYTAWNDVAAAAQIPGALSSASDIDIISTNAGDTTQTVTIVRLDANFNLRKTSTALNGTNNVEVTATDAHGFLFATVDAATTGDVDISLSNNQIAKIAAGEFETHTCSFRAPAGYDCWLVAASGLGTPAGTSTFDAEGFWQINMNNTEAITIDEGIIRSAANEAGHAMPVDGQPLYVPEKARVDLELNKTAAANAILISGWMEVLIVKK